MNGCLKAALIVGVLAVIGGVLFIGGGALLVAANKDEIVGFAKEAHTEGVEMAEGRDQDGCVEEGFARFDACEGITCHAKLGGIMATCLRLATPVDSLCEGVPEATAFKASVAYRSAGCAHLGYEGHAGCGGILGAIQNECQRQRMLTEMQQQRDGAAPAAPNENAAPAGG